MSTTIQFRRGLASAVAGATVADGEPLFTTDTHTLYVCNGGVKYPIGGTGDALTANPLSQFAATTSLQLKGVISDETGSGALVFATSPTLVTPVLGVATATSINGIVLASGASLIKDTDGTLAANSDSNVATQKATKSYVDALIATSITWKQAVRVATTANGTLATAYANGQTVDGITLATGDRILIKNQTTATENGIYVVAVAGPPTRATDTDTGVELQNATVLVSAGTANSDTVWTCNNTTPPTVGVSNITFAQVSAATTYSAGTGLGLSGTTFNITDAELLAIAGLTSAADSAPYFTGSGTAALMTVTSFVRTLLDDTTAAAFRTTLGAGSVTSVDGSGGTTGLTLTGGAITTSGTLTLGGVLGIANGGTGQIQALDVNDVMAAASADIASASTTDLTTATATGEYIKITGTTGIDNFGNYAVGHVGARRTVRFAGALTITHNATAIILPGGANITTAAGDVAVFRFEGSSVWRCVSYTRAAAPPPTGTNTGDQTSVSGNAGTATAWATGRTISITGDIAYTSPSIDGTGNVTAAGTLATVNSNVGTFGSATKASIVTVNAKGLVTAASESTVTPAVGSITGLGTGVATALAVNVGSVGAPVVNGGALGTPSSGVATNLTGTASGLTAGNVTTNANLTGDVTSVGNATTIGAGKVTAAMLATSAQIDSFPIGTIFEYGGASAPAGCLVCDGGAYSRVTYAALFALCGTTYGAGDGSTTFNVPDCRGRVMVGSGTGSGLTARTRGVSGGEEDHTLTTSEIPPHAHQTGVGSGGSAAGFSQFTGNSLTTAHVQAQAGTTGQSHNNMQPFLVSLVCIKALAVSGATAAAIGVFAASGPSNAVGLVPAPGATAGTTKFLREDATWVALYPAPTAPTNLTGVPGNTTVVLSWTAQSVAANYRVYRATSANGTYTLLTTQSGVTYTATGLTNGTTYYFVVSSVSANGGEGDCCTPVSAAPVSARLYDTFTLNPGTLSGRAVESGSATPTNWTVNSGTWTVGSGTLTQTVTGGSYAAWADAGAADGTLTCQVGVAGSNSSQPNIIGRIVDASNWWEFEVDLASGKFYIYELTSGTYTQRAASAAGQVTAGSTYTARVVFSGNSMTFDIGGASINYSSSVRNTATKFGVQNYRVSVNYANAGVWDEFKFV